MIVVADTGPLRYLVEVEAVEILPKMFGRVLTTPTVMTELGFAHFPEAVRRWAGAPPGWLEVMTPVRSLETGDRLHAGEAEAIALAVERSADRLLIDDMAGVEVARSNNVRVLRTLTVVAVAAELGHLRLGPTLERLATQTAFRATPDLYRRILNPDAELARRLREEANDLRSTNG